MQIFGDKKREIKGEMIRKYPVQCQYPQYLCLKTGFWEVSTLRPGCCGGRSIRLRGSFIDAQPCEWRRIEYFFVSPDF